jgi:hypothetical protein
MYVLAFFAGLTFFFMAFAIFKILPRGRAEKRLKSLSTEAPVDATPDPVNEMEEEEGDSFGHVLIRFLGRLSGAKGTSADGEVYADARRRLMEAGFRRRSAVSVYNGSRIAFGGLLPVLLILIFVSTRTTPPMVVIAVSALVGYLIPGIILDNIRSRRIEEIRRHRIENPRIELSSTEIRRQVAEGSSIRYRTTRAVEKYIQTHGLYV